MSDDPPKMPPISEWTHEVTGGVRKIADEQFTMRLNGSLERLEKGQRWTKAILYFLGILISLVATTVAVDHWVGSLATKADTETKINELGNKLDALIIDFKTFEATVKTLKEKK
jgi:hypothetical protein